MLHILRIVQILFDDYMHHRQRQRAIRAGANGDPLVGSLRRARVGRVDDEDACTLFACVLDKGPEMEIAGQCVAAPDEDQPGVGIGFGLHALGRSDAINIALKAGLRTNRALKLRSPHAVEKTCSHSLALQQAHCAGIGIGQHGFGPVGSNHGGQPLGNLGDRLSPAYRFIAAAAFGAYAAQGRRQTTGMIGALQVTVHLAAQSSLRDRVIGVAPDIHGAAGCALDGHLPTASVGTIMRTNTGDNPDGRVVGVKGKLGHGCWLLVVVPRNWGFHLTTDRALR